MFDLLPYVLALVAGIVVKVVDWLDDNRKSKSPVKYLLAIIYGALIGYLISVAPFSALFLAAVVAQVFARKIDTAAHQLGVLASAIAIAFFGFPMLDIPLFLFFLVFAFLDEADYIGRMRPLMEYRPFLKVAALVPAIWGRWDCFAAILLFDIGYEVYRLLMKDKGAAGPKASSNRKPKRL